MVTRRLISQSVLNQFQVAEEIAEEGKGADRRLLGALQQESKAQDTSASVGSLRQQWLPRRPKVRIQRTAGDPQATRRRLVGRWDLKVERQGTGFSRRVFSPHVYKVQSALSQLTQALGKEFPPAVGVVHLGTPGSTFHLKIVQIYGPCRWIPY